MSRFSMSASRAWLAAWSIAELLSTVVAMLIITPALLHRLDANNFSAWVLAQSVLLAAPLLSIGTGNALLSAASNAPYGETHGAVAIGIRFLFRRASAVSLALLIAGLATMAIAWLFGNFEEQVVLDVSLIAFASLVWMFTTELDSGLSSALKAEDGFVASATLEILARAIQVVLTILLVPMQGSALVAIAIAVGVLVIKVMSKALLLWRVVVFDEPEEKRLRTFAVPVSAAITANGRWICLGVLSGFALNTFDRWIVGALFDGAVLAAYAICTQIAQLPHAVAAAAAQVLTPWAAVRAVRLDDATECRRMVRIFALSTAAAVVPSGVLFVVLEQVLAHWISPSFAADNLTMARSLTVVFAILTLNVPAFFLALGLGSSRVVTLINTLAAVIFVVLCTTFYLSMPMFIAAKGACFGITLLINIYLFCILRRKLSDARAN